MPAGLTSAIFGLAVLLNIDANPYYSKVSAYPNAEIGQFRRISASRKRA